MAKKKTSKPKGKLNLKLKEGAFTEYCKRKGYKKVTTQCIEEGLRSSNPKTRKRANFAKVSRTWNKGKKKKKIWR